MNFIYTCEILNCSEMLQSWKKFQTSKYHSDRAHPIHPPPYPNFFENQLSSDILIFYGFAISYSLSKMVLDPPTHFQMLFRCLEFFKLCNIP